MDNILAVDSSGKTAGVCILQNGIALYEKTLDTGLTHSETLLPMVQKAMEKAGLSPKEIALWAVANGPGSFTGLRIGVCLIKGLAFANNAAVFGVSTLKATALASGLKGTVVAALNARRGQVYWAAFLCGATVRRLSPDKVQNIDDMKDFIANCAEPIFFVGDGAEMCYNAYVCMSNVKKTQEMQLLPVAKAVAMLAKQSERPILHQNLQPCYLRPSKAERDRAALCKEECADC